MKLYHTVPNGCVIKRCGRPAQIYRSILKTFDFNRICKKLNGSVPR